MSPGLETLAIRLYVTIDDLLTEHPQWAHERPTIGIAPKLIDAELITLAVIRALLGYTSEARFWRRDHVTHHHRPGPRLLVVGGRLVARGLHASRERTEP